MSASSHSLASHFETAEQQRSAATVGMWVFLTSEVLFFGGLFCGYAVYRSVYHETWAAASRHLDLSLGTLNTAVLLTSSLTMAVAVRSRQLRLRGVAVWLVATIALGCAFLGVKAVEYAHKWHEHFVPGAGFVWGGSAAQAGPAELFFSFYFVMTGVHALHMVIGIGVLAWLALLTQSRADGPSETLVENVGLYWHLVDIVWVYLFPLLYLIDRTKDVR